MGNVKENNKPGMLIYSLAVVLIGLGLVYAERTIIELYFQPSQTLCTFAILSYLTFAFFWNGSRYIHNRDNNHFSEEDIG